MSKRALCVLIKREDFNLFKIRIIIKRSLEITNFLFKYLIDIIKIMIFI